MIDPLVVGGGKQIFPDDGGGCSESRKAASVACAGETRGLHRGLRAPRSTVVTGTCVPRNHAKSAARLGWNGRYWARTSDPQLTTLVTLLATQSGERTLAQPRVPLPA